MTMNENEIKINETKKEDNFAENTLNIAAYITLALGICVSTVMFLSSIDTTGYVTSFEILLFSFVTWALLKVIANISVTLKEIKDKM